MASASGAAFKLQGSRDWQFVLIHVVYRPDHRGVWALESAATDTCPPTPIVLTDKPIRECTPLGRDEGALDHPLYVCKAVAKSRGFWVTESELHLPSIMGFPSHILKRAPDLPVAVQAFKDLHGVSKRGPVPWYHGTTVQRAWKIAVVDKRIRPSSKGMLGPAAYVTTWDRAVEKYGQHDGATGALRADGMGAVVRVLVFEDYLNCAVRDIRNTASYTCKRDCELCAAAHRKRPGIPFERVNDHQALWKAMGHRACIAPAQCFDKMTIVSTPEIALDESCFDCLAMVDYFTVIRSDGSVAD